MKQRIFDGVRLGTRSIWSAIDEMVRNETSKDSSSGAVPNHARIVNALYDRKEAETLLNGNRSVNFGLKVLKPSIGLKRLAFWESLYLRFDPDVFDLDENFDAYAGQQEYYSSSSSKNINNNYNNQEVEEDNSQQPQLQLQSTWKEALARREKECQVLPDIVANYVPSKYANNNNNNNNEIDGAVATDEINPAMKAKRAEGAKECWQCGTKFGFFKSMVVCAMCGGPFCSKCAPFTANQETHGMTGQLCVSCHALAA
jgi:hypothetical protein